MKKKENRKKGCTYIKLYGYESIYFRKKNRNKKQKQLEVKEIENCERQGPPSKEGGRGRKNRQKIGWNL